MLLIGFAAPTASAGCVTLELAAYAGSVLPDRVLPVSEVGSTAGGGPANAPPH